MTSGAAATPRELGEELLLLAAYLLSSGRGLFDEPPAYGPLRCADAARRVLGLVERAGIEHPEIHALRAELDELFFGPMGDGNIRELLDLLCERTGALLHESDVIQTSGE
ncbi:DUF6092 family protein [Actinomadura oligospora]|uniref:DUF6092 family protein n=1 Tax=Actinomadura oligospora TaxID=111804 RepID=UPI000478CEE7|nr:DUF6092 family protein [Actinomadura oligospora]